MALPPPTCGGAPCVAVGWLMRFLWATLHKLQMDGAMAKRIRTVVQVE